MQKWARKYIREEDRSRVSEAIQKAEQKTTGEIVVMVVQRSSVLGHVPWVLTLLLTLLSVALELPQYKTAYLNIPYWLWPAFLLVYYFISLYLAKSTHIQRWFVPKHDQIFQVHERAELEFYHAHVNDTEKSTGVLIFISLMERRCVVLGDKAIASRLKPESWQNVVDTILEGISKAQFTNGLINAIEMSGKLLNEQFPAQSHDKNELSNELIVKA